VKISIYTADQKAAWDAFVDRSKNGVFFLRRDYLEYHADRFDDFSLMFRDSSGAVVALLPASLRDAIVTSHAGLTFGGVVSDERMKAGQMLELFQSLEVFLRDRGIHRLVYKAVPHIYHRVPAEEDLYALFRCGARLFRRDISSTINMVARLPFNKGRKWSIKQALKATVQVEESRDFHAFMRVEEELLARKYGVTPTHSAAELQLLASRFPEQIKLFVASAGRELLAGVVIYEHPQVAHVQYIAATEHGKVTGALDFLLGYLITERYSSMRYFDFGISTEKGGLYLNTGLIDNKQGFGGRAVVHDFYEWDLLRQ
jgi:hypothetical protein